MFDQCRGGGQVAKLEEIRQLAFVETLRQLDVADDTYASALTRLYLRHRFEDIEPFPDALGLLQRLKRRYPLALLSNGNGYPERQGFADIFDVVVFSQQVGFEKPDARIFSDCFAKLGHQASATIHVGDSLRDDYYGAESAGAKGVWLNRDGMQRPDDCKRMVTSLDQLGDYL